MRIQFSARANREFVEAADYLLEHKPEAAANFADMLEAALAGLQKYPQMGRLTSNPPSRVFTLSWLPYRIFYEAIGNDLYILSIFHTSQKPDELGK